MANADNHFAMWCKSLPYGWMVICITISMGDFWLPQIEKHAKAQAFVMWEGFLALLMWLGSNVHCRSVVGEVE